MILPVSSRAFTNAGNLAQFLICYRLDSSECTLEPVSINPLLMSKQFLEI